MSTSPLPGRETPAAALRAPLLPLFVCAGCRPVPLPYAIFGLGDCLEEMQTCPNRERCTWYVAHDLGGSCEYSAQPEAALLPAAFRTEPYFWCPNFDDYDDFLRVSCEPAASQDDSKNLT